MSISSERACMRSIMRIDKREIRFGENLPTLKPELMNSEEFKQRFLPLHGQLYRTAFRMMGNAMDAEDMVQEAYLKLWERRDALEHVTNLDTYSTSLLRNLCIDAFRRKRPEEDSPPPEEFPFTDN